MTAHIEIDDVEELILLALKEDIGDGDVTSEAIFTPADESAASMIAKEDGVFCGADMVKHVYSFIDPKIRVSALVPEGSAVTKGTAVLELEGPTAGLLSGERTALNFIQRMGGIATKTSRLVTLLEGTGIRILDTRKTLPGFRLLDKYAVRAGGGSNHRMGLYDMVMIKDNHIKAAGSITAAVETVRRKHGSAYRVEVETTTLDEVAEAVRAEADIIMLDNMDRAAMEKAAGAIGGKARIEVSGNMDEARLGSLRGLAVDFVSIGALTHSVQALDLSMKFR
ncbi:MAG TPA: carboxylating nicotinate-nucleotide diphosphorylase [Spirochaetota bacterium]|nr:carboxylating nicotinate-nucleotide diphosphorylase [Spirochaetota bacterium]HPI88862.1 carboxylating nicotinate-nucleotide diphosphorylase [Spirochaetota bacterium]HPR47008.1 carboxylating nicotinate-nucleotide diphosphorylase [Spirochaetota bacterium]